VKVAIIGAGYIGEKRAAALQLLKKNVLKVVSDIDLKKAKYLAEKYKCDYTDKWKEVIRNKDIDVVNVATSNDFLAEISIAAMNNGKHVLCEKPLGRNLREVLKIASAAEKNGVKLKAGFNHRFHPAIQKARGMLEKGKIGKLLYIRCVYGHGGRKNYEKEWRMNPEISGGGELIDQGIHILDLFRWFMGVFRDVFAFNMNFFSPAGRTSSRRFKEKVEDNSFCLLRTEDGRIAQMHASVTQWKNKFLFEIFGEKGFLIIDGLGGSYGTEKLIYGERKEPGKVPNQKIYGFPGSDISFFLEWKDFLGSIRQNRKPCGDAGDGVSAMELVRKIYKSAKEKKVVQL